MAANWWDAAPLADGGNWWDSAPLAKEDPPAYKDRTQALDDAVNFVEEGQKLPEVTKAFQGLGISESDIIAHGRQRKSELFANQLPSSSAAPQTADSVKSFQPSALDEYLVNPLKRGMQAASRAGDILTKEVGVIGNETAAQLVAKRNKAIQAAAPGEKVQAATQEISEAGQRGIADAAKALATNPGATWTMLLESVVSSSPSLATSGLGAIFGPVGSGAGAAAGSFATEYGSTIFDSMSESGLNPASAADIEKAFNDPAIMSKAREKATKRGLAVATFDGLTAGIAGRFMKPALGKVEIAKEINGGSLKGLGAGRVLAGAAVKEAGVQAGGGMAGEAVAQGITDGKLNYSDILLEGLAEVPGGAVEVGQNLMNGRDKGVTSFTPANSITAQAGLPPIVVPTPRSANVSVSNSSDQVATEGGAAQSGEPSPSLGVAGLPDADGRDGGTTGGVDALASGAPLIRPTASEPPPAIERVNPLSRASDSDLLSRAIAQQPEQAEVPVTIWTGRAGDGYADTAAAEAGLATRMKREPDLRWEIEQMPSGKYRLAGYERTSTVTPMPEVQPAATPLPPIEAPAVAPAAPEPAQLPVVAQPAQQQEPWQPPPEAKVVDMRMIPLSQRADFAPPEDKAVRRGIVAIQDGELKQGRLTKLEAVAPAQTVDAQLAEKIADTFKAPITWVRDARGKLQMNGATLGGRLFLNASANAPAVAIAMHEVSHNMPADIKGRMVSAIMDTVTPEQRASFLKQFNYKSESKATQDEELAMRIIEQDAQKPEFWKRMSEKIGQSEFVKLAKEILKSLDAILAKFKPEEASEFTSNIRRVRDVVADAYSETLQRQRGPDAQNTEAGTSGEAAPDQTAPAEASAARAEATELPGAGSGGLEADGLKRSLPPTDADRQALDYISQQSDLFSLPRSTARGMEGIIADNLPGVTFKKSAFGSQTHYKLTMPDGTPADIVVRPANPYGPSPYGWSKGPDGEMTDLILERPGENAEIMDGKTDVWIDVSKLKSGELGQAVYNIAATYAHNNGMVFIGDPNGLSDVALRRRTENMLNSALKFGTTEHLGPHPRQVEGDATLGVPPLHWVYGDDVGNIERMIDVSIKAAQNADYVQPAVDYAPSSAASQDREGRGRFVDGDGLEVGQGEFRAAAEFGENRAAQAGWRTLARMAVFESLLRRASESRAEGGRAGGRGGILAQFGRLVREFTVADKSDRIFYSRPQVSGPRFTLPDTGRTDAARIKLQDDALRMKRVIDAVKDQGGTVGEEQNFYDANTLMPGRVQAMMDDFRDQAVLPLVKKLNAYNKANGTDIGMDDLALYAYARHAPERNSYIASINPKLQDGGSGMTDADAAKIVGEIEADGHGDFYRDIHADLMGITASTRRILLDEGLITQEQYDAMESQYQDYIPLRGFENVDPETGAVRPGIGRGINIRGKETIKALGRSSRAGDLIENVIRDFQRAVVRSEKNNVAKVLLDFVLSNPDPDLWGVDVEKGSASFDKSKGQVDYTKVVDKGEDTIGLKVGGQQVYIQIQDKALVRALRHAWKDETGDMERAAVAVSGWYNSLLRNVLTRYNPPFALVNMIRDTQSGAIAALDELGAKGAARFAFHYPKALAAASRDESARLRTWFGNPVMDRYFKEFKSSGAITGGFFMKDVKDIAKDLRADLFNGGAAPKGVGENIKAAARPIYKAASTGLALLEFMGSASENATRFALYMAAREGGRTPSEAALLAKNGTTNFNRKGEWGGTLNALYLFFNASVQGSAQLFKTLKNPKVLVAMASVAGLGFAAAMTGASGGGEDDDGQKYWDKIPDYEKERNFIFMLPPGEAMFDGIDRVGARGRYIKIPVQYGLNFFPNIGYMIADVIRNQQDERDGKTLAQATKHLVSITFGSVNPFGGSTDVTDPVQLAMAVAPTILDLPIMIAAERNSFGSPVAPAPFPGDNKPDSERSFASQAGSIPERIARVLNELGGGNEAVPGQIMGIETSVAPGTIKNLIQATTGGLGAFILQTLEAATRIGGVSDKSVQVSDVPFLNKLYAEVDEDQNIRLSGDRAREVAKVVEQIKDQVKDGLDPEVSDKEEMLKDLAGALEVYQKEMRKLRKEEVAARRDTEMSASEKRQELDSIKAARDDAASAFNYEYVNRFGPRKTSNFEAATTP